MEFEGSDPHALDDSTVEESIDAFREQRKAKTRITLVMDVDVPFEQAKYWPVEALFGSVARQMSFMGAKYMTLFTDEYRNLEAEIED
jgi:hypothetical protein